MRQLTIIIILVTLNFTACKQEYVPPVEEQQQSLLVVEGNLNAGADTTIIRLTRSQSLNDSSAVKPEINAQLVVEGKDNSTRILYETGNGNYISPNLNLIIGNEYRLRIKTTNGKEYLSDYVKAKATPPIDSVGWHRREEGIDVYVNTSDSTNSTRYYRWEYAETWQIHSTYGPELIYENGAIRYRVFPQEDVSVCWKNNPSTSIIIGSTTRLQQDIVNEQPLVFIPSGDEKLSDRYSIFVKQYALDADSYAFYELLKKNTENIGSIFSPQPTEIKGNLHCLTNPDELIIGYITASTVATKRIFISPSEVPQWNFYMYCPEVIVLENRDSINAALKNELLPSHYYTYVPAYILFSRRECVDCTTRGGSTVKPPFW